MQISKKLAIILFSILGLIYLIGAIFIDVMDIDSAQYAQMGMEMLQNGNILQVKQRGLDYLDKPPLIFWTTAISYFLFGISNFTFRLPTLLSTAVGLFATYRLGRKLYDHQTGLLASLILGSCQAYFMINHDVRTDTILTNMVILAIWQLVEYVDSKKFIHLFWGFVGIGLAMLEKGPLGLMVPVLALGPHFLYKREWKNIFKWQWIIGLVIIAALLTPMTIGLYQQFGWEGPEFFFWTQSFGRITGENEWRNDGTVLFFTHTFLWMFFPWMLIATYGFFKELITLIKSKFNPTSNKEIITLAGFLLPFIALSLSHYKLPHYIVVMFPLMAIITGKTIMEIVSKGKAVKAFFITQIVVCTLLTILTGLLVVWAFPVTNPLIIIVGVTLLAAAIYYATRKGHSLHQIFLMSIFTIYGMNFFLNAQFYPELMKFQSYSVAAKELVEENVDKSTVFFYEAQLPSFDFYMRQTMPRIENEGIIQRAEEGKTTLIYTQEKYLPMLDEQGIKYETYKEFNHFHVTELNGTFLNPATREKALKKAYILKVK